MSPDLVVGSDYLLLGRVPGPGGWVRRRVLVHPAGDDAAAPVQLQPGVHPSRIHGAIRYRLHISFCTFTLKKKFFDCSESEIDGLHLKIENPIHPFFNLKKEY